MVGETRKPLPSPMRRQAGSTSTRIVRTASSSPARARTARSANTASRSSAVASSMRARKWRSVSCSMVNVDAFITLFPLVRFSGTSVRSSRCFALSGSLSRGKLFAVSAE